MEGRTISLEGNVETVALPAGRRAKSVDAGNRGGRVAAGETERNPKQRSAQRLEKAQTAAVSALTAVSSYLDVDEDLPAFFCRLSETVAGLVGARRAAFWRLGPRGVLGLQPKAFGFPANSRIHTLRIDRGMNGAGTVDRVVFGDDLEVVGGTFPQLDDMWRELGLTGGTRSIAVPWRAGARRIGAVVAYDSRRGFTSDDVWVLRLAAMATGLVWQHKESEDEL